MWKDYELPLSVTINEKKIEINAGWTNIIDIFNVLRSEGLLNVEKAELALTKFYKNWGDITSFGEAFDALILFINGNRISNESDASGRDTPLVDWGKDLRLIIPPVNKVLGYDVRERPNLHWWTFLGAFNEIGECTFQTYVGIRYKIANRKPLEKWEKELYRKYKDEISVVKAEKYDNFDNEDILVQLAKQNEFLIEK